MLDNISLLGPDEEELSLASVVASATLLPGCAFAAWSTIVNIVPSMGKRAALFYLTRGSIRSIWIPVFVFLFALVARRVDDRRAYAIAAVFSLASLALAALRLDINYAAVYLAVALCCGLAAVKAV